MEVDLSCALKAAFACAIWRAFFLLSADHREGRAGVKWCWCARPAQSVHSGGSRCARMAPDAGESCPIQPVQTGFLLRKSAESQPVQRVLWCSLPQVLKFAVVQMEIPRARRTTRIFAGESCASSSIFSPDDSD